ncbi:SART-1 family protein DOT2-like [Lycium ferocissimum]|uniref:SART-1 family protein DOT2-like n=1 Tax=Lycium ferocissimum TaxID=112874 RepID=UPI0028166544|nr:SART-1 family protein DOT2-like [Lycium ferocissimum]
MDQDNALLFDNDDNVDLTKTYKRARKLTSKKQKGLAKTNLPESIVSLINDSTLDHNPSSVCGKSQVVFTEMGEFVSGLQLHELKEQKPSNIHVLPNHSTKEEEPVITPDQTIREVPIGKGLSEALKLMRERGTLKEDIELGGRNTDKKKNKLVDVRRDEEGEKEIHIERTDEYGRNLTPKEAFRVFCHGFHGKEPGKKKQEKRMRQYQLELKIKKMKN